MTLLSIARGSLRVLFHSMYFLSIPVAVAPLILSLPGMKGIIADGLIEIAQIFFILNWLQRRQLKRRIIAKLAKARKWCLYWTGASALFVMMINLP